MKLKIKTKMNQSDNEQLDLSFPISKAYPIAFLVLILAVGGFAIPFVLIWGGQILIDAINHFLKIYIFLPVLIVGTILHELLHSLFLIFSGSINFKDIKFGLQKDPFTPYTHCHVPVNALVYRISTIAPGIILGITPCIISVILANGFLLIFGVIFTFAASVDFMTLWTIRKVKNKQLLKDHPDKAGCVVITNND